MIREVKEETGYSSLQKPIFLGEYYVNPATQNNKIKTFLILEAFKSQEQDLDDTENIKVRVLDFDHFGNQLLGNEVKSQLFTVTAYLMAKNYMMDSFFQSSERLK